MHSSKKQFAPIFIIKLLVSLSLLVFSVCLVTCTKQATVEEQPFTLTTKDATEKLTAVLKSYTEVTDALAALGIDVDQVIKNVSDAVSDTQFVLQKDNDKFKVHLPNDKTAVEYVNSILHKVASHVRPLDKATVEADLVKQFSTTPSNDGFGKEGETKEEKEIIMSLDAVETIFYQNYKITNGKLAKGTTTTFPTTIGESIKSVIFSSDSSLDLRVYLPKNTRNARIFVSKCAGKFQKLKPEIAPIKFVENVMSNLATDGDKQTKWSEVLAELLTYGRTKNGKIEKYFITGGQMTDEVFKRTFEKNAIFPDCSKIYLSFGKFYSKKDEDDSTTLINYLNTLCDSVTDRDFHDALYSLLLKSQADKDTPAKKQPTSRFVEKTIEMSVLRDLINAKFHLLPVTITDLGVVPSDSFKIEGGELKCATFPTPTGSVPSFEQYVTYVAGLTVNGESIIDKTQSEDQIKKSFFTHLWDENTLSGYKSILIAQPTKPTQLNDTTGGDGGIKPMTRHDLENIAGDLDEHSNTNDSKLPIAQNSAADINSELSATSSGNSSSGKSSSNSLGLWLGIGIPTVLTITTIVGYFLFRKKSNI